MNHVTWSERFISDHPHAFACKEHPPIHPQLNTLGTFLASFLKKMVCPVCITIQFRLPLYIFINLACMLFFPVLPPSGVFKTDCIVSMGPSESQSGCIY